MNRIRKSSPVAPVQPGQRAALQVAIAARVVAEERLRLARQAESRGSELLDAAEAKLAAFGDIDTAIIQHRAAKFKTAAAGGPAPDTRLPDDLETRRRGRDEARDVLAAAKAAHDSLVADVAQAQKAFQRAERLVDEAAQAILAQQAVLLAANLKATWAGVWHLFDTLSALPGSSEQLPAEAVRILRMLPGIDHRQWAGGKNAALARAKERWKAWFAALLTDANAPVPDLVDDGASSAPVHRVA